MLSQHKRLELIQLVLARQSNLTAADRAAAVLLLVFGQPITRISRMRPEQIKRDNGSMTLHVTDDPVPVPTPFDTILAAHLDALPHQTTSAHRQTRWLFPGSRPGQSTTQSSIMSRLRAAGIDLRAAKNSTLRALALEIPAAIVADTLGYSYQVADKHRHNSGATFIDYVNKRSS